MRKILLFLAFGLATGAAQAQIKCWNEGGRRVCGDAPPAGAKVTTMKGAASGPEAAPAANDEAKDGAKAAKKGPITPAEQEQEYRKRQAESQKSADKAENERKEADSKRANCQNARDAVRQFESGQRISRTDASGERYFLDESQMAQEAAKARQIAKDSCS